MKHLAIPTLALLLAAAASASARAQDQMALAQPGADRAAAAGAADPTAGYLHQLHDQIATALHYPTSREARQLQPTGTVRLWIDVDRSGHLLASGLERSSGRALLDQDALRNLRNARLPAFPAAAYEGQADHRFEFAVEYQAGRG